MTFLYCKNLSFQNSPLLIQICTTSVSSIWYYFLAYIYFRIKIWQSILLRGKSESMMIGGIVVVSGLPVEVVVTKKTKIWKIRHKVFQKKILSWNKIWDVGLLTRSWFIFNFSLFFLNLINILVRKTPCQSKCGYM